MAMAPSERELVCAAANAVEGATAVEHAGFKLVGAELIRRPADARERRHDLWGEVR